MFEIRLTDDEVKYLQEMLADEPEYWETGVTDGNREQGIRVMTLLGKLQGLAPDAAELQARRQVDRWLSENNAPGGL